MTANSDGNDSGHAASLPDRVLTAPLEQLEAVFRKKHEVLINLGEKEKARLCERARDLARARLAARLGEEMS